MSEQKHSTGPLRLYAHRTDGGAEYLTDAYIECRNGHREGVFEGANIIIRLDGAPECIKGLNPAAVKALVEAAEYAVAHPTTGDVDADEARRCIIGREQLRSALAAIRQ